MTPCNIKHVDQVKNQLEDAKQWAGVRDVDLVVRGKDNNIRLEARSRDKGNAKAKGLLQELIASINTQFSISGDLVEKMSKITNGYTTNVNFTQKALDELEQIAQRNVGEDVKKDSEITPKKIERVFSNNRGSTIAMKEGNDSLQEPLFDKDDTQIKPGVQELFDSNPELASIGTQEQYSQYLDTIFPDIILPIGTSGSGKSTFIKSLPQENLAIIEPDAMRVEFTGNINDKSKDKEIYEEAAKRAIAAIQGKETPSQIYSKLGNKTKTPNIVIQSVYQTAGVQYAKSINGVFSLRINGTNNQFGNPFSSVESEIQKGLIRTKSTRESVEKYIEWVLFDTTTIKPEQHKFIREHLQSGKLKNKPIVYYKELGEPSHATALDYLINKYDWNEKSKQVVFDTTNLTKDKRLPFIEAIKKAIPTANIQYKLMELNPELAKQRIKAQIARGENRANVPDSTIDRHAESYEQMLEDIKNEPITEYKELGSKQDIENFAKFVKNNESGNTKDMENYMSSKSVDYIMDKLIQSGKIEKRC